MKLHCSRKRKSPSIKNWWKNRRSELCICGIFWCTFGVNLPAAEGLVSHLTDETCLSM